jgi:hypothetical protein
MQTTTLQLNSMRHNPIQRLHRGEETIVKVWMDINLRLIDWVFFMRIALCQSKDGGEGDDRKDGELD